jgi:hypothetical protein
MKQRRTRGGTVDGIRRESLPELGRLIGVTDHALSKYIRSHGQEFNYYGHRVIMDPPARANKKGGPYVMSLDSVHARKPIEPMERIQVARKSYNAQGVASRGLLIRK